MATSSNRLPPRTRMTKTEFPIKLYAMLELADYIFEFGQAVNWLPHGRAFVIHNKDNFMKDVVPVFFNQTQIRSFNRQLHLWGFRRYRNGRSDEQIWYHDNFLRGKPEDIKLMTRTKIKGNMAIRSEDVSVPDFYDLPPLPVCYKRPPAILDTMENAILILPTASGAVGQFVSTMPSLSPSQELGNVAGGKHHQAMVLSRTDSPRDREVNVDCSQGQSFQFQSLPPPHFCLISNGSQAMMNPCVPAMDYHSPLQVDTIGSTQPIPMHETSAQGHMLHGNLHYDFCFGRRNDEDFEPLPFTYAGDYVPCDDFASFIEGSIHQIENSSLGL
ncbi:hypothetical protein ACHAWT_003454 [Skeletonema menzelii]